MADSEHEIKRCIDHLGETDAVRKVFWRMDEKVPDLVEGIRQGDDCIVVGRNIINMEGPYPMKIGMKTGLIHTCSDIVVMGGKPLYALNAMQVDSIEQAKEVSELIRKQSDGIGVPILGGNTQMENDLSPCVSFCIFGELHREPVFDSTSEPGNRMVMIGAPVEGEVGDRIRIAKEKFDTFQEVVQRVKVYASKDASRGGWLGNLTEMMLKARTGFKITSIPYPSYGRYMGNYMTCLDEKDVDKVVEIASKYGCPVSPMGEVTDTLEITLGRKKLVNKRKMTQLIRSFPFKKPKV